jgi:catechol 2,3-dioxygenase-like lactoylglutathione lyase family enzyme
LGGVIPVSLHVDRAEEKAINRAFTNILCVDVQETARFYETLLGLKRVGDYGWFVLLGSDGPSGFELGIIDRGHETIPTDVATTAGGVILTFVVDDLGIIDRRARSMNADVIDGPTALSYGQTRLLLRDPSGTLVDVSSPTR